MISGPCRAWLHRRNWFRWALLSAEFAAEFAALTAIFANISIQYADSVLAMLIRTAIALVVLSAQIG
jgi:transporter family protein